MRDRYNIVAINGSHRSENGFTEIVLKRFLSGAELADAYCEVIYPSKQRITTCQSCGKCMFETPGVCKYNDDMESIISKMEAADLVVFASPVYFDSMSSNMQKMIERLRSTLGDRFEYENGRTYHRRIHELDKKIVTIFTAGNPERESFITIKRIFNRIVENMGWRLEGEICFPASHFLVAEPDLLSSQLEAVAMCGRQIVAEGKISSQLLKAANKEYIDNPEKTLHQMSRMIRKMREDRCTH